MGDIDKAILKLEKALASRERVCLFFCATVIFVLGEILDSLLENKRGE